MAGRNIQQLLELSPEAKKQLMDDIAYFYEEVRGEQVGIIGCEETLDFFLEVLGAKIYNQALDDAKTWSRRILDNAESDYYALYKED